MKKGFIVNYLLLLLLVYSCSDFKSPDLSGDALIYPDRDENISNLTSKADTLKINDLIEQGKNLSQQDPDSAIDILNQALRLSVSMRYNHGIARALHILGVCQFNQGDWHNSKSNFFKALKYYQIGSSFIPTIYSNIGNVFLSEGYADSGLYYYNKSLSLVDMDKDPLVRKVYIYNGISASFLSVGQMKQAWHYLTLAMKQAEKSNNPNALAYVYARKADLFETQSLDSSIAYRRMSHEIYKQQNDKVNLQESYASIGKMWILKRNADSAQYYFDLANNILIPNQNESHQISSMFNSGNIFFLKGQYKKALQQYKEIELKIQNVKVGNDPLVSDMLLVYNNLALIYHRLGQNLLAYQYQKLHNELKDSIFTQDKLAAINRLEAQFSIAGKDRDLLAKQLFITKQNSKIQKQYLGISLSVILILLLLIILYKRKHRLALIGIKSKLTGVEQERLRLAQEIHDGIVSKLTSIKMNFNALPDYEDEQLSLQFHETLRHLDDSITELRQTTHNLHPALLQRVGLLKALNSYSAQINAGGLIELKITVEGVLPSFSFSAELHLFRILQELIQNIIKHAQASEVVLSLAYETDELRISIIDNGKGVDYKELGNNDSIGLSNLRDRVQLLQGTMKVQHISRGTIVYLTFLEKNLNENEYEHKDLHSR